MFTHKDKFFDSRLNKYFCANSFMSVVHLPKKKKRNLTSLMISLCLGVVTSDSGLPDLKLCCAVV